jgi:hypothetical protein
MVTGVGLKGTDAALVLRQQADDLDEARQTFGDCVVVLGGLKKYEIRCTICSNKTEA